MMQTGLAATDMGLFMSTTRHGGFRHGLSLPTHVSSCCYTWMFFLIVLLGFHSITTVVLDIFINPELLLMNIQESCPQRFCYALSKACLPFQKEHQWVLNTKATKPRSRLKHCASQLSSPCSICANWSPKPGLCAPEGMLYVRSILGKEKWIK